MPGPSIGHPTEALSALGPLPFLAELFLCRPVFRVFQLFIPSLDHRMNLGSPGHRQHPFIVLHTSSHLWVCIVLVKLSQAIFVLEYST